MANVRRLLKHCLKDFPKQNQIDQDQGLCAFVSHQLYQAKPGGDTINDVLDLLKLRLEQWPEGTGSHYYPINLDVDALPPQQFDAILHNAPVPWKADYRAKRLELWAWLMEQVS